MLSELTERRVSLAVTVAAVIVFAALLLAAPPFYPSFDEWKYFGIGYQFWAGHGITTVFGGLFLLHGPIWPILVTAPHVFLGWDTPSWGRFLDALSGTAIVALAGWFGWRIRPTAGALAAVAMVALLYLHDQTRTARLDVPAAAFALLYVAVAIEAVRRGSVRWAIAAGAFFAIGFLIKEIVLPFAPVPFLAGVAWGRPWVVVGRVAAWTLLVATIGISWWFALYAIELGRFYRLETPAWTLIPVAIAIVILIAIGLGGERLAATERIRRFAGSGSKPRIDRYARWVVAYGGTALWSGLQLYAYTRTSRLKGGPILTLGQLELYARQWFVPYLLIVVIGIVAILLSFVALVAYRRSREREPIVDLLIASICGAPLVLLVVGVGEPPRNYIAQIAIAAGLGAIGVLWAIEWVLTERRWFLTAAAGALAGAAAGVSVFLSLRFRSVWLGGLVGAVGGA
ncbi:MAG TPA: hypothetical protein VE817_02355, partial [Candidatus Acidoferrum sp.]|nr:hypothetical protein [Candidatus Acidoferrum sp.]